MNTEHIDALMHQLAQTLPGIPIEDLPRFANSLAYPDAYMLTPESMPHEGTPHGSIESRRFAPGAIYPDVAHDYWVYVPQQYDERQAARLIVFLDGARYLGPEVNAPALLDNLIHAGELPATVAIFVNPGANGPGLPIYGGSDNRSVEYDSLGDTYSRFLLEELLPEATRDLNISHAPDQRVICGISSGGICAFNVAWERPDTFGKVICHCGSFVNIRGGHALASQVRRVPRKSLQVSLQTGLHDLNIVFGDWLNANREMAAALAYRDYVHRLDVGESGHSIKQGAYLLPNTLRWLWPVESIPLI